MEPLVVRQRAPWLGCFSTLLLGVAVLVAAALVHDVFERVLMAVFAVLMFARALEAFVRLAAGDVALQIGHDGVGVSSLGFVPWADVVAFGSDPNARTFRVDVRTATAAWRELPRWRRVLIRVNRLVEVGAFTWPLSSFDQPLETILDAVAAEPEASAVRITLPKRMMSAA